MPSQGFTVQKYHHLSAQTVGGIKIPITIIDLKVDRPLQQGNALFAYWFVSEDRLIASQGGRLVNMAIDNVFHGVARHWAYIAVLTDMNVHDRCNDEKRLVSFVTELYPSIQASRR